VSESVDPYEGPVVLPDDPSLGREVQVDYPGYRSTRWRVPKRPLVTVPEELHRLDGPVFGEDTIGELDNDLTRQHAGEPIGERITVSGRVLDEDGRPVTMYMGCYGIGVTRLVAAAIEQGHDERGIVWPTAIAPFEVALVPINLQKSHRLRGVVDETYDALRAAGVDVFLDDRDARPGVKFADMDLVGIPHRVVLSDKGLDAGTAEYKRRRDDEPEHVPLDGLVDFLAQRIAQEKAA